MGCFSTLLPARFQSTDKQIPTKSSSTSQESLSDPAALLEPSPIYSKFENNSALSPQELFLESRIDALSTELRKISLQIHDNPELSWKEYRTAKILTEYMRAKGFTIITQLGGIETAWSATFTVGKKGRGRTIGFNSEMDALPGLGHACGHNLIAIAGVAAAVATKETFEEFGIDGEVILLGTPAEEKDGGKINLIKAGAYSTMDACLMLHPAPFEGLGECLAISEIRVEYTGHSAHAALAPWEGINALDAAVAAYSSLSLLRQQIKPTHRLHGIIIPPTEGWVTNVIPEKATLTFGVRAPTIAEVDALKLRVEACFDAAALATGCSITKKWFMTYKDLKNSAGLGREYQKYMEERNGMKFGVIPPLGSTDFGDVSYELPSLHPMFAIPVAAVGSGNHTKGFEIAAGLIESHHATLRAAKGIAIVGLKVIEDGEFTEQLWKDFEASK